MDEKRARPPPAIVRPIVLNKHRHYVGAISKLNDRVDLHTRRESSIPSLPGAAVSGHGGALTISLKYNAARPR